MTQSSTTNSPARPAANPIYRIAIVEDLVETRESVLRLLQSFAEFDCVCACVTGEEALKQIPQLRPELVLMDIFLPRMSGIECTARLKALLPATRIVILTSSNDEDRVFPALEAGADGYLLKHIEPAKLHAALLDAVAGGVPMTSGIARRVAAYFRNQARLRDQSVNLSPRENDLLTLLSKGYSNKEIADKLSLTVETVRTYLKIIYEKMHVRSRTEAAIKYIAKRDS